MIDIAVTIADCQETIDMILSLVSCTKIENSRFVGTK